MGYTHYWDKVKELNREDWADFTNELVSEIADNDGVLCEEYDMPKNPPVINDHEVRFNGKGLESHETFHFTRVESNKPSKPDGRYFNFCKTALKRYDKYVVKTLLLAEKHFGRCVVISSDGDWSTIRNEASADTVN